MNLEALIALGQSGDWPCCGMFFLVVALIGWWAITATARRRAREAERQQVADAKVKAKSAAEANKAKELAESKTRRCPHNDCQHENKPGARFCGQCGRFMDGSRNV